MNFDNLRRVFGMMGLQLTNPNHKGWSHISCPFAPWLHRGGVDRSAGFAVKIEDAGISAYDCKACKSHGRISGLARKLGHLRQQDYDHIAVEADKLDMLGTQLPQFDQQYADNDPKPAPLDEAIFANMFDPISAHPAAAVFMERRHVSIATCEKLRIEYDPEKKRIVFPVRDGTNGLYGWSGRTIIDGHKPKVLDYAGLPKRHLILGEERWRPGYRKAIVEGLFAYARMHEIGVEEHFDIGALLGSTLTDEKAAILMHHGAAVYAFVDPDPAGDMCLYGNWNKDTQRYEGDGLIDQLTGEVPVMIPPYPQGVKDIDDVTLEQFLWMANNAQMAFPNLDKKSKTS